MHSQVDNKSSEVVGIVARGLTHNEVRAARTTYTVIASWEAGWSCGRTVSETNMHLTRLTGVFLSRMSPYQVRVGTYEINKNAGWLVVSSVLVASAVMRASPLRFDSS